jgi:ArsR family transcriptional regulator
MKEIDIIGSKTRIKILYQLSKKDAYVSELIEKLKLDGRNCKHHLNILEQAKVISSKQIGRRKYYSLEKEIILHISPKPKRRYELQFYDIKK